jgi:type II secretory pathway component PulJ
MRRTRSSRRGFTIVEVLLVVGAVSLVLGLCAGLLHVLLRLDRTGRAHLVETTTVGRLARQFRQDVHAATRAKPVAGADGPLSNLELAFPEDRIVAYEAREHALVRTQNHGAEVERRETYTLPFRREPRFLVRDDEGKVWVSLRLPRGAESDTGPKSLRHDLQIEALAGRDHRLTQPKELLP